MAGVSRLENSDVILDAENNIQKLSSVYLKGQTKTKIALKMSKTNDMLWGNFDRMTERVSSTREGTKRWKFALNKCELGIRAQWCNTRRRLRSSLKSV